MVKNNIRIILLCVLLISDENTLLMNEMKNIDCMLMDKYIRVKISDVGDIDKLLTINNEITFAIS
ncbi:hypothetical protein BAX60_02060 [Bacillus subtilis]|nr:hypothetical protein BAX60_02060 [Bacillus subtilis]